MGGVGTIAVFIIYVMWIAIEINEVYIPPGKFTVGSQKVLTQGPNGTFPLYNTTKNQFFTTYRLWSMNETINADIDTYVSGLWVQRKNKKEKGIYSGIKCTDKYDEYNHSPQFMS